MRKATQPGDQLRLRGRGLPELGSSRIGDLFVQFRLKVPPKTCQTGRGSSWRSSRRKRTERMEEEENGSARMTTPSTREDEKKPRGTAEPLYFLRS